MKKIDFENPLQRSSLKATWTLLMGISAVFAQPVFSSPLGDGIRFLQIGEGVKRSVALRDLGITEPVVLAGSASQDFYLPVPHGVALKEASIDFDGRYLKGELGNTSVVLSINGIPALSQSITDGEGILKRSLPVVQTSQAANFVRLGVNWRNQGGVQRCDESYLQANSVTISPLTRLSYLAAADSLQSIDEVWGALPTDVGLLVAGQRMEQVSFDSAWRIGTALLRAGKRMTVRFLPAVGDEVDVKQLSVPAAFAGSSIFASLKAQESTLKIMNEAQLGALIVLGASQVSGDIVLADQAMQQRMAAALDALNAHLSGDADAINALKEWRSKQQPMATEALASKQIRALPMGRQMVLGVAADAGAQLAGLQEAGLQRLLTSTSVTVPVAHSSKGTEEKGIRLSSLGGVEQSFDVVSRGNWTMSFPLSAVASQGKAPSELTLFLAAAPGASTTKPVASVFWNGVLLTAKQLDADGRPEQLRARVPGYALGVNNTLRVSVQRQPYSANCNEIPQGYPVSVLSSASYLASGAAHADGTFVGLLPLMAGESQLFVPENYLSNAPISVERIASLAAASGVSASQSDLVLAKSDAALKPSKPFLSMGVSLVDVQPQISVSSEKQLQIRGQELSWLDVVGLSQLSSAEVVKSNGQQGILWHAIGDWSSEVNESFLLNRGNMAVIGHSGPLAWIDSSNPGAALPVDDNRSAFYEWREYLSWGIPTITVAVLLLLLLLFLAWRVARKNKSGS